MVSANPTLKLLNWYDDNRRVLPWRALPGQCANPYHVWLSEIMLQQTTDAEGRYAFTSVKPVEYEVPTDGPIGAFFEACGRHAWRPSHLHFIIEADGYWPLVTEVFAGDDPYLDQDTVFGVREDLVMFYEEMPAGSFPQTGFALSGQVPEAHLKVSFDLTLVPKPG